jgi:hypothetical protein
VASEEDDAVVASEEDDSVVASEEDDAIVARDGVLKKANIYSRVV